jgi:hypothetical protein
VTGQTINGIEYPASTCQYFGTNEVVGSMATAIALVSSSNLIPKVTMRVQANAAVLVNGSPEKVTFMSDLATELATALGVDVSNIEVSAETTATGATVRRQLQTTALDVEVAIHSHDPSVVLLALETQISDENSQLHSSDTFQIDTTIAFAFACPRGLHRPEGAADCIMCPGNSYPDQADATRCKECSERMVVNGEGTGCVCAGACTRWNVYPPMLHSSFLTHISFIISCRRILRCNRWEP